MKLHCCFSGRDVIRFMFCLALGLLLCPAFAPGTALAGQTIIIDDTVPLDARVFGNGAPPYGSWATEPDPAGLGDPNNNRVIVNSGIMNQVLGGWGVGNATGNSVVIKGGTVVGNVLGGYSQLGNATHNTVTISGSPTIGGSLWGAFTGGGDAFTGNTLNVWNYTGSSVASVQNFQYYNFVLPASLTGLNVTGAVDFTDGGAGRSSVTGVSLMGGGSAPQPGDALTLIHAGAPITDTITNDGQTLAGKKGATLNYLFRLDQQEDDLFAVVEGAQAAPQTKVLSEGFLAGVTLVNQGADLIAGKGIVNALSAAGPRGTFGFGTFGAISGGWSRYNTGSHVDVSGLSLIAGLSFGADLAPGRLTLGAFFEYGGGSYDTYNSFGNVDANGNGTMYHYGGGILGRMDFLDTGPGNFYTEASFRAGGLHNDYSTSALRDAMGNSARGYDSFSPYYGVHVGAGYIWKFTEKASLDLYGKYFWTRQQGSSVRLTTGDPVEFKDVDSHRLRLGGRFAYAVNEHVTPYIGAAWEYEMDGRQKATTYGYDMDTPTLYGSTGIGELGLTLKPSKTLPLSFDLGVRGYVGKREGLTGSLQIRYEF